MKMYLLVVGAVLTAILGLADPLWAGENGDGTYTVTVSSGMIEQGYTSGNFTPSLTATVARAKTATVAGNCVCITSETFVPPGGWGFSPFPDYPSTYVDVRVDGDTGNSVIRLQDTAGAIQVSGQYYVSTAAQFPLHAQGDMSPGGGYGYGGYGLPTGHWATNTQSATFILTVQDANSDNSSNTSSIASDCTGPSNYSDPAANAPIVSVEPDDGACSISFCVGSLPPDGGPYDYEVEQLADDDSVIQVVDSGVISGGSNYQMTESGLASDSTYLVQVTDTSQSSYGDQTASVEAGPATGSRQMAYAAADQSSSNPAQRDVKAKTGKIFYIAFDGTDGQKYDSQPFITYLTKTSNPQWIKLDNPGDYAAAYKQNVQNQGVPIVYIVATQAQMKQALGGGKQNLGDNSYIMYTGHSNFGMGFNFNQQLNTKISDFMRCAEPDVPINWIYMRQHQGDPNFMIQLAEYGDNHPGPPPQYDPQYAPFSVVGQHASIPCYHYANNMNGATGNCVFYNTHAPAPSIDDCHSGPSIPRSPYNDPVSHSCVIEGPTGAWANAGGGAMGVPSTDDRFLLGDISKGQQLWTVTCDGPSNPPGKEQWSVGGSLEANQPKAQTGVQYTTRSGSVMFTITAQGAPFAKGDSFTFTTQEANLRLVAVCGASDMPAAPKWKMLCLNSCYSGQYYYNIFNHGTLFYTTDLMYFGQGGSAAYVNAIMAGQDEDGIWQALQATKVASETTLYDWKKF